MVALVGHRVGARAQQGARPIADRRDLRGRQQLREPEAERSVELAEDDEVQWAQLKGSARRNIRHAREAGADVTVCADSKDLREFYEPHTGEGLGAVDFGWSSLICELVDPDPAAAGSYL